VRSESSSASDIQEGDGLFPSTLRELTEIANTVLVTQIWFEKRARPRMVLFRTAGVLVIVLSVSVPFIAAQTASWKDTALSIAALIIAMLTGLTSFFRWEQAWRSYRQTQYALEHFRVLWKLRIVEAKHHVSPEEAIKMAIKATDQLLLDARAITSVETSEYFKNVQMPKGSNQQQWNAL
jgi:uncharacterized protein DUF4231